MEANLRLPRRSVGRAYEVSRLEEELWAFAYAQLRPVKPLPAKPQPKAKSTCAVSAPLTSVDGGQGG